MGYGGPVWHASVSPKTRRAAKRSVLRKVAMETLKGVGDTQHEWEEMGESALHVRRRLSDEEIARVGMPVDCRSSSEGFDRFNAMLPVLQRMPRAMAIARMEVGGP